LGFTTVATSQILESMRLLFVSLFLLSFLPAPPSSPAQSAPALTLHDLNEADSLGTDLYTNSGATGLVLVVVRGDQVYFRGYGETASGSHQTPGLHSVVRLCSLTKIFTTDLLAKLVSGGTVRLDDTLEKYAPQSAAFPEKDAPITLEELATHTSGLEREVRSVPRHTPHFTYPDLETRWRWLASAELKFAPGTQALYSNVGFDLLSDTLAKAAQTPYPTLLDERTLKPLRMWETTFYPSPEQCQRLMTGARDEGPCTITTATQGSSGLYSTPADMEKFLSYLVGVGTLAQAGDAHGVYLLPSSLTRQFGLDHAGSPSGIGLGWMHLGTNEDLSHIIEKTGGGAGFTTYIALHPPSHTALFVAVTDGPPHAWKEGFNLFKASNNGLLALAGLPPFPDERRSVDRGARHRSRTTLLKVSATKPRRRRHSVRVAQQAVASDSSPKASDRPPSDQGLK
jgi:D-alanyl-D-alanine-carboxypeptidase/D-alanyl-D-alanine-endopeptidase